MLAAAVCSQGESSYSMKADRQQPFAALGFSMAGGFGQDMDKGISCAAAKLPEGHMCSKQFALRGLCLHVQAIANTVETPF